MNSKLLKVLHQIDSGDDASFICELPQDMMDGVHVDAMGNVDGEILLNLCQKILEEQEAHEAKVAAQASFERNQFLMRMIYDPSVAVQPQTCKTLK